MHKPSALGAQRMSAAEIRRLRAQLGWAQARFAVVIDVHRTTVSRWECGRRRPCDASTAAESVACWQLPEWEFQDTFYCEVWRPLIRWSEQQVIEIHHRHGLRRNPLYLLGATRVGCWPCIFARKSEFRLVADTDPARIVRLRVLGDERTVAARARAARDDRQLPNAPTWFQNPVSRPGPDGRRDGSCWPIDHVVEWSRSAGRGPWMSQDEYLFAAQLDGCMRWGLCDTGAANTLPAEVCHAG